MLLDLIAILLVKLINTNQEKVDVHVDKRDAWKRVNSVTNVENHFNLFSEEEIIDIKKLMEEADLDKTLIRE